MKTIIKYIFLLITAISFAQSPIIPLYLGDYDSSTNGYYLKDLDHNLDPFIGAWTYTNGNTVLVMEFQKVEMYYKFGIFPNRNYYKDALFGEYIYMENGVEKINTFPLNVSNSGQYFDEASLVFGQLIVDKLGVPDCPECIPNVRYAVMSVENPDIPTLRGRLLMAHFIENGVEKIRMRFYNLNPHDAITVDTPEHLINSDIPEGVYTLIKQ